VPVSNGVAVSRRAFQSPTTTFRLLVDNSPGPDSTFYAGDGSVVTNPAAADSINMEISRPSVFTPIGCIGSPSSHPYKISSENGSPLLWTGLPRSHVSSSRLSISMPSVSIEQLISGKITGGTPSVQCTCEFAKVTFSEPCICSTVHQDA
jgi:hypothetical protein